MATTIAATSNSLLASLLSNIDSHIGRQNQDLATGDPGKVLNGKKHLHYLVLLIRSPHKNTTYSLDIAAVMDFSLGKQTKSLANRKSRIMNHVTLYKWKYSLDIPCQIELEYGHHPVTNWDAHPGRQSKNQPGKDTV